MPYYRYTVKNEHGEDIRGKVEARNKHQAAVVLRERGLLVVKIDDLNDGLLDNLNKVISGIKYSDIVEFTRQLSTMITAGLSLIEALTILEQQASKASIKQLMSSLIKSIEGGTSFSDALQAHPKVFSVTYVQLVKAGELGGILDDILERLADNMEKSKDLRGKIKGAMVYPVVVLVAMIAAMLVMMLVVVPKMNQMYEDLGATLPTPTLILIGISNFFVNFWWLVGILLVGAVIALQRWRKTEAGALNYDKFLFKIPIVGRLRTKIILTEYSRTLSLLMKAGVSLLESLEVVAFSTGSVLYRKAIHEMGKKVEKGVTLSQAIQAAEVFPPILVQMTAVGEETGKMDDVLMKLSVYFQNETENAVKGLMAAIEPLIMVLLGIGVGFMVIAVIMPIYNLTSQF